MFFSPSRRAETSTTTGTGAFTLSGATVTGARSISTAGFVAEWLCAYAIEAVDASGVPTGDHEYGIGDISGTTLNRRFVIGGSNGTSAVNFGAGTKYVYVTNIGEGSQFGFSGYLFPFYQNDFIGPATAATVDSAASVWDYAAISSGTQAKQAGTGSHPGILRISSSTTANSGGSILTDTSAFIIAGGEFSVFCFRPVTLTNSTVRLGFLDTTSNADSTDGVYFELPATGAMVGKTASNATRSNTSTLATLSTNTWYRAVYAVNHNGSSVWFGVYSESGSLLGSGTLTTNIPTAAGREFGHGIVATNSGTTAVGIVDIDYMSLGVARPLVR